MSTPLLVGWSGGKDSTLALERLLNDPQWHVAGLLTTPRWSLLRELARAMRVPVSDIDSYSTTVKLHAYRFHQPVQQRQYGGTELDVDFSIDSPAGVSYSLVVAGFAPGAALDGSRAGTLPLIRGFQWAATARISVKM